jgi:hypothetical protein
MLYRQFPLLCREGAIWLQCFLRLCRFFFLAVTRVGAETWLMLFSLLMIYGLIMLSGGKREYAAVSGLWQGPRFRYKYTGAPFLYWFSHAGISCDN